MKTTVFRLATFIIFFAVGFNIIIATSSRFQINRDPAAIRQVYDFSHLRGSALENAVKERMLAGLEVHKETDRFGIGFGHFAFLNPGGEKTLGCREFSRMVINFEAEGIVVNGERPRMEVEGACEFSSDLSLIDPLYIPVAKIMGERPADGEFQFREGQGITVRFSNISDEWPRKWILTGMKMVGKTDFTVDKNDLDKILGHPFLINLQQ